MNDKQRAEFESKFGSAYWFDNKHNEKGDYYFNKETQIAYLGYQAAHSSPSVRELVKILQLIRERESERIENEKAKGNQLIEASVFIWADEALETWRGE